MKKNSSLNNNDTIYISIDKAINEIKTLNYGSQNYDKIGLRFLFLKNNPNLIYIQYVVGGVKKRAEIPKNYLKNKLGFKYKVNTKKGFDHGNIVYKINVKHNNQTFYYVGSTCESNKKNEYKYSFDPKQNFLIRCVEHFFEYIFDYENRSFKKIEKFLGEKILNLELEFEVVDTFETAHDATSMEELLSKSKRSINKNAGVPKRSGTENNNTYATKYTIIIGKDELYLGEHSLEQVLYSLIKELKISNWEKLCYIIKRGDINGNY